MWPWLESSGACLNHFEGQITGPPVLGLVNSSLVRHWFSVVYVVVVLGLGLINLWPRLTVHLARINVVAPAQPIQSFVMGPNSPSTLKAGPVTPITTPVNLNTASQAEIESLPGVGPALASRILEGRPYSTLDDLDKVKGIGPKLLERLRPLVSL